MRVKPAAYLARYATTAAGGGGWTSSARPSRVTTVVPGAPPFRCIATSGVRATLATFVAWGSLRTRRRSSYHTDQTGELCGWPPAPTVVIQTTSASATRSIHERAITVTDHHDAMARPLSDVQFERLLEFRVA